jgi:hypothetical protein
MENKTVSIDLPSGVVVLMRDGTDLCNHSIEKQREICLLINNKLKRKIVIEDRHFSTFNNNYSLKEVFTKCLKQYERENTDNLLYEHVEHPNHYNHYSCETIDMMVAIWGKEKVADWCEITAFKYRMRMGTKPDNSIEQDLKKEQWYLNKAKELRK